MAVRQTVADTKMTKSSGEHWVCSMLSQYGWGAALTRDGLERTDILAVHTTEPGRPMRSPGEVLNYAGPKSSWPLGTKAQGPSQSDREWFVLVLLGRSSSRALAFTQEPNHSAVLRSPGFRCRSDLAPRTHQPRTVNVGTGDCRLI